MATANRFLMPKLLRGLTDTQLNYKSAAIESAGLQVQLRLKVSPLQSITILGISLSWQGELAAHKSCNDRLIQPYVYTVYQLHFDALQ